MKNTRTTAKYFTPRRFAEFLKRHGKVASKDLMVWFPFNEVSNLWMVSYRPTAGVKVIYRIYLQ